MAQIDDVILNMEIIYLAGNSTRNRDWIEEVKKQFDEFSGGEILYYDHWARGEDSIMMEAELKKLADLVKDKDDYYVFAKSIGTIVTLTAIGAGVLKPKKAIFCGLPCSLVEGGRDFEGVEEVLKGLTMPTIFVQNEFDKVGGEKEIKEILGKYKLKDCSLVINPGVEGHNYEDYRQLMMLAREFFK